MTYERKNIEIEINDTTGFIHLVKKHYPTQYLREDKILKFLSYFASSTVDTIVDNIINDNELFVDSEVKMSRDDCCLLVYEIRTEFRGELYNFVPKNIMPSDYHFTVKGDKVCLVLEAIEFRN